MGTGRSVQSAPWSSDTKSDADLTVRTDRGDVDAIVVRRRDLDGRREGGRVDGRADGRKARAVVRAFEHLLRVARAALGPGVQSVRGGERDDRVGRVGADREILDDLARERSRVRSPVAAVVPRDDQAVREARGGDDAALGHADHRVFGGARQDAEHVFAEPLPRPAAVARKEQPEGRAEDDEVRGLGRERDLIRGGEAAVGGGIRRGSGDERAGERGEQDDASHAAESTAVNRRAPRPQARLATMSHSTSLMGTKTDVQPRPSASRHAASPSTRASIEAPATGSS